MKKFLAIVLLLIAITPASAAIFGPLFSGSSQTAPPAGHAPVVASFACTVALPVVNATNVNLVGGGTCNYTATCNGIPCNGGDAITSWAITAQSTANSFSIVSASGILQGGSAAGSVTAASYTVTVTATNSTGTSPGVVQTVTVVIQPPVVSSLGCTIKSPITNNTNVTLQAGGNCQYSATNTPTSWAVTADTCASCYQVTNAGILQGSTNAATVTNRADTVTITATNAGGTSAPVAQTVTAISVPAITNQNASAGLPLVNGQTIMTMVASPTPSSWAITAVSSVPAHATISDFAISSSGVITTTSSAPTDITTPQTVTISVTATNATGTSTTGTATVTIGNVTSCPQGTGLADGCAGAQLHGVIPFPHLADANTVTMINITPGSGYTNGSSYGWTSTGGGCSVAAAGTVSVSGGKLANGTVSVSGTGCTSRPTIAIPAGAGGGSGGAIVPTVYQATPHNASTPYNIPGVDYPVGYDTTLTLKDPSVGANLPSCATYSAGTVTINSNSCTLNGFDFSLHNGVNLAVANNLSGVVISNNKFVVGSSSNTNAMITVGSGACGTSLQYNTMDGAAQLNRGMTTNVEINCNSGTFVAQYNYCLNFEAKCYNYGAPHVASRNNLSATQQYNLSYLIAIGCAGGHGENEYSYQGYTSGTVFGYIDPFVIKFNTYWVPFTEAGAGCSTSSMAMEADAVGIQNGLVQYNFNLLPGPYLPTGSNNCPGSSCPPVVASSPMYCGSQENGVNTGGTMNHNYLDYTGAYFPYNTSSGTCAASFPGTADINPVTGNSCNQSTCN